MKRLFVYVSCLGLLVGCDATQEVVIVEKNKSTDHWMVVVKTKDGYKKRINSSDAWLDNAKIGEVVTYKDYFVTGGLVRQ